MNGYRVTVRSLIAGTVSLLLAGGLGAPSGAYQRPGETERVSVSSTEDQGGGHCVDVVSGNQTPPHSLNGVVSGDGRFVAFESCAQDLVPGDTNDASDVFVRDRKVGTTSIASVTSAGIQPPVPGCPAPNEEGIISLSSTQPSISADGRYVAFESCVPLVTPDLNPGTDIFVKDMKTGEIEIASVDSKGLQGVGDSQWPAISPNGRYVTFTGALDLLSGLPSGRHVYIHDRKTGETELVDLSNDGEPANHSNTGCSSVTSSGRFVLFYSQADNLVAGDTNLVQDVFVRDRKLNKTERVSVASDGTQGITTGVQLLARSGGITCTSSGRNLLSRDGRIVVFESGHDNLVPNDSGALQPGVFAYDRSTKRTERITVSSSGVRAVDGHDPAISASGRWVTSKAYGDPGLTGACNGDVLVQTSGCSRHVFVYDRKTGAQEWASMAWDGHNPQGGEQAGGALSGDGTVVVYQGISPEIVPHDTNDAVDIFARERGVELGVNGPTIAGSARFSSTGFVTRSDRIADVEHGLARMGSDLIEMHLAYRPQHEDLFVAIELEYMPQVIPGVSPIFYGLRFEVEDGKYEVRATSLHGGTFGLFDCTNSVVCTKIADLRGGYGTAGMRVVFSLPLQEIGLEAGGELEGVTAFSALGTDLTGATKELDRVAIK